MRREREEDEDDEPRSNVVLKRIRNEEEIRQMVHHVMNLQENAIAYVLNNMRVLEVFFADQKEWEFSQWLVKRNIWAALFRFKVSDMLPEGSKPIQVGINARWNCLAWYFTVMAASGNYLDGYRIRSMVHPNVQGNVQFDFVSNKLIQISVNISPDRGGVQLKDALLGFVKNRQFRTHYSQIIWEMTSSSEYYQTLAQIFYKLFERGFYVMVQFGNETYYIRKNASGSVF